MAIPAYRRLLRSCLVNLLLLPLFSSQFQLTEELRVILGVTVIIYVLAGRVIFRLRGSLRNFAGKSAPRPPVKDTWSTGSHISRAMSPDLTSGPAAAIGPLPSYTVIIESGPPKPSTANNRAPRNSAVEANTAAWAYCRCAMLFFLALLITWVCHSLALLNEDKVLNGFLCTLAVTL